MMILNAHLYSYMMSLDAILLNLIVPDRTTELLHTSCWHQRRRWTQRCFCQRCSNFVVLSSRLRRWRTSLAAVRLVRPPDGWSDWAVSLLFPCFYRMLLTPPLQRNTDHLQAAATRFCAWFSVHWRKNPALRLVTLNPLCTPSRTNSHLTGCECSTRSHGINIQVGTHSNTGRNKVHCGLMTLWVKQLVVPPRTVTRVRANGGV